MRKVEMYQINLSSKFNEIEELYYEQVDELFIKLKDINVSIPSLELFNFSFIQQWEEGAISSNGVRSILDSLDFKLVAKQKLTKKITKAMIEAPDDVIDYYKTTLETLVYACVPKMIVYLEMLQKFFNYLSDIDDTQIPVSWIQTNSNNIGVLKQEYTFNQIVRKIDTMNPKTYFRYYVQNNVILLEQALSNRNVYNWLFAPASYIKELKKLYDISLPLKDSNDLIQLKTILGGD